MRLKCKTCKRTPSISYDKDPEKGDLLGRPWYVDDNGLKHLAIVCLHCGTIHDASGSFLKGIFSGFKSSLKVHNVLDPMELSMIIMEKVDDPKNDSREFTLQYFGLPETVIDVLVERNILGPAFAKQRA